MTASRGDELGSIPCLRAGGAEAQVNGLLPAHDAYVKAFMDVEDDFADFVEEDDNDGKYQWASADSELAASFRSRRSKYRNRATSWKKQKTTSDLAYLRNLRTCEDDEDENGSGPRLWLRMELGGAMSIEAQISWSSPTSISEAMELAAAHGRLKRMPSNPAENDWMPFRIDSIVNKVNPTLTPWWIRRSPSVLARRGAWWQKQEGRGKGGGGKGGGSRAAA